MEAAPSMNWLSWLTASGGWLGLLIVAIGLFATCWGLVNLFAKIRSPKLIAAQLLLAITPLGLGFVMAWQASADFSVLAASSVAPKPAEFAAVVSHAFFIGLVVPTMTAVPAALCVPSILRMPGGIGRSPNEMT